MRRFWFIVSCVLVAFWAPLSSHALLECAGLIHVRTEGHPCPDNARLSCHAHPGGHHQAGARGPRCPASTPHEHHDSDHAFADGACLSPPVPLALAIPGLASFVHASPTEFNAPSAAVAGGWLRSGLPPPGIAPPELPVRWQFMRRAAQPARAPSLVAS